jgi:hypothetical protein
MKTFTLFCVGMLSCACVRHEETKVNSRARAHVTPSKTAKASEPAPLRPFRESVGVNVKFTQGQPLSDLPLLTELGVHWVRDTVDWATLEPEPGKFAELPAEFVRRLEFYKAHDIGIVFLLGYQNDAAYAATESAPLRPIEPVAFGRYALEVARRLRREGVRFVLEIWNEPHNFSIRKMVSGSWNGAPPAPWLDHYLKMADEAVRQVKDFDQSIRLLSDDDMWIIHYWYLERGLTNRIDGFAFHPYTRSFPERAAVDQSTDWVKPFTVVDADASFQSAVRRLREQGQRKLGKVPEMWATEWGWAIGQESPYGPVTEELLAAWLPRAFVSAAAASVQAVCWFSVRDSVDGPMGLTTNEGVKRKPYFAFKAMSQQLGDSAFMKQVFGGQHLTHGSQGFLFRGAHDVRLVVWNEDQSGVRLLLRGELASAHVVDGMGQPIEPARDDAGVRYVTVEKAPLYLSSLPGSTLSLDESSFVSVSP